MKRERLPRKNSSSLTRPKKLLPKLRSFFSVLGLILILLGIFFWLKSDFWQIKRVTCQINGDHCSDEVWAELMNLANGENFFLFSPEKAVLQLTERHPEFFQIDFKKEFPDGLFFKIVVREAVVILAPPEGDFYLVDQEGIILGRRNESGSLPVVLLEKDLDREKETKIEDELILGIIRILYEAELRLLRPQSAKLISERTIEVRLTGDLIALFSTDKNLFSQLDSLQFIFERSKIEGDSFKRIDLRFDKPVVVR